MRLFNSEANNRKIKAFNEAQERGEYRPYISANFMSAGTRSILKCPRTGRDILLLSQTEKHGYINLIYKPKVIEIKEQYALDLQTTLEICEENGWVHPRDHETGELKVCTTDLLVIEQDDNGRQERKAYSFKYQIDLDEDWRAKQKLELEEIYWKKLNVAFELVERMRISKMQSYNLINLSHWYEKSLPDELIKRFATVFLIQFKVNPLTSLTQLLRDIGHILQCSTRRANVLFANCVLRLQLRIDLSCKLEYHQPVSLL